MRIAVYSTNECPYPVPRGIIQAALGIAGTLADAMTERGQKVDFFCTKESKTKADKRSLGYRALIHLPINRRIPDGIVRDQYIYFYSQRMICDMVAYLQDHPVDLIHLHNIREALPVMRLLPHIPKVVTLHDNLFNEQTQFFIEACANIPLTYFVSISQRQRQGLPHLPYVANVYNGTNTQRFRFQAKPDNYLLFSGRLLPAKGIDVALQAARQSRHILKVAGDFEPRQAADPTFTHKIRQGLHRRSVVHLGHLPQAQLAQVYGKAKALLVPIRWEEPFGLVMIEAMACGTPVIAFKRGAVSEIIQDGKTGFIVRTLSEMVRAIKKIDTIKRQDCRDHAVKNFSFDTMADHYLSVYQDIVNQSRQRTA